jgi:hypothetical protein
VAPKTSIALQIGTLFDGSGQLAHALRKNRSLLGKLDIRIPRPRAHRGRLTTFADARQGATATPEELAKLWIPISDSDSRWHLFLSEPTLIGSGGGLLASEGFLPQGHERPSWIRQSLQQHVDLTFFLGLRNPASFAVAVLNELGERDLAKVAPGLDPFSMRWSTVIARLREANPDTPMVIWMREEIPYIWPQLMHLAAGLEHPVMTEGIADGVAGFLRPDIAANLEVLLERYNNYEPDFLAKVFEKFAQKYAARDIAVDVIDVPGWTGQMVAELSEAYLQDIQQVAAIDGVTVLGA